jgi:hypothetical protein
LFTIASNTIGRKLIMGPTKDERDENSTKPVARSSAAFPPELQVSILTAMKRKRVT